MKKSAIYPGTFDPITYGHIDVIKKGLKFIDKIIIAISDSNQKNQLFNTVERIEIVKNSLYKDIKFNKKKVKVISFNSLTTDLCKKYKSNIILRGLRAVSDFDYEFQMSSMNAKMRPEIETVCLMASDKYQFIASSLVKEIAKLGGDVNPFVSPRVATRLAEVLKN